MDNIVENFIDKHITNWFKKNKKYLFVILLYFFYQTNFIFSLLYSFGINVNSLPRNLRILCFILHDLVYVAILIFMFKKQIQKGLKDLKENFISRAILSLNCWVVGSIIMTTSSVILSIILKQNVSNNEELVRQSIQLAPLYMLFTCSIVAPIFEEMVFRVSLNGLIKNKFIFIISSGLCFGLLHVLGSYTNPLQFLYVIPYGAMGCAFAFLLTKTKNITLPIIIHMIHNTILVMIQIIGG